MVNFSNRKRVAELTNQERAMRGLVLLAIIIFVVGGWAYWHFVHSEPKRVFQSAIDNALQTRTISKQTIQGATGQSLNQKIYVATSPSQIASGSNEIIQTGEGSFHVVTSMAGTPTSDFVKYDFIQTDQKDANGKAKDFHSVLGIWGETTGQGGDTTGQLYNQSVLGVVPFGNLSLSQRQQLTKLIQDKKVYQPDMNTVKKQIVKGRPTYTYDVTVNAEAYISMLKMYGSFVGLTQLANTNPADYKDTAPLHFQFVIDVWTGQLAKLRYSSSVKEEIYGSQGIRLNSLQKPKKTIPIQELQQRVQAIE